jgi:hypothetical protein
VNYSFGGGGAGVDYARLRQDALRVFPDSDLVPVPEDRLAALRRDRPGLPADYVEFLRRVGAGRLGRTGFMFYAGPIEPGDVLDAETAAGLAGVLFLGDDFAGWLAGFDTRAEWRLVGVSSAFPEEVEVLGARSVGEFMAGRIADHEAG